MDVNANLNTYDVTKPQSIWDMKPTEFIHKNDNKDTSYHYDLIPDAWQQGKIQKERFANYKTARDLKEAYSREDEIRKETQAREDTAYQRATEDMRKAGIDPNLHGVTQATSGGGITNASRNDMTYIQNLADMLLQEDAQRHERVMQNKTIIRDSMFRILPNLINAMKK